MIAGTFFKGSGLGNQLFRYIAVRTIAEKKGYEWGMQNPENFKGDFLHIDKGQKVEGLLHTFEERKVLNGTVDVRGYDERVENIQDNTLIDGEFQDERYFDQEKVKTWLDIHDNPLPEEICIINYRGGEYVGIKDLYLTEEYWLTAQKEMQDRVGYKKFMVVTDDVKEAQKMFPFYEVNHDMEMDWRMINSAKYLILSNSSFAILPALLGKAEVIVAPKNWARRNTGIWAMEQNKYHGWHYV